MHTFQKAGRIGSNTTQTRWATGGADATEIENALISPLLSNFLIILVQNRPVDRSRSKDTWNSPSMRASDKV